MQDIKAIIFDLGGVVLNLSYDRTINAFKALGEAQFEQMYTQAQQDNVFDALETGAISPDEFRAYLSERLKGAVTAAEIDEAWNAMLLDLPAERITLLRQLADKYRIFLFSNTNAIHYDKFREIIAEQYGNANLLETIFEQTYYSHVLGKRKPNPDAFQAILDEQNLVAENTLFIDDSIQHIHGAASIGLQTHHLENEDILKACASLL